MNLKGLHISFNTRIKDPKSLKGTNGYGYATECMLTSLENLGAKVTVNDATAPFGIVFDQPQFAHGYPNQYSIFYMPWESTELQPGWGDIMNCWDEVWTPSQVVADWFVQDGIEKPVHVYEHGIDHIWTPKQRVRRTGKPVKYLIIGAEATRKNGWQAMNSWTRTFADNQDVSLTMKTVGATWNKVKRAGKVEFNNQTMPFTQLKDLFYEHDVIIHASSGEGFGLPPLQALASGMITVCVDAWAPYADFIDDSLKVDSKLKPSPWPSLHPGKVFIPDYESLEEAIRCSYENFDELAERHYSQAPEVHTQYDWDSLTYKAFKHLLD